MRVLLVPMQQPMVTRVATVELVLPLPSLEHPLLVQEVVEAEVVISTPQLLVLVAPVVVVRVV